MAAYIRKRRRRIAVYFSPEEEQYLKDKAKAAGFDCAAPYIRQMALGEPVRFYYRNASLDEFTGQVKRFRLEFPLISKIVAAGNEDVEKRVMETLQEILKTCLKIYELCMSKLNRLSICAIP